MTRTAAPRRRIRLLLAAVLLLAAGCGSSGAPRDLSPQHEAQLPTPASVTVDPDVDATSRPDNSCDPTRSLRPGGLGIPAASTMAKIRKRGKLRVGVDQNTYLFGFLNPANGNLEGFDIDLARAIGKRLLGSEDKVVFRAITSGQREDVLTGGDVDLVVRTYTINCDRRAEVEFSSVYYEAGQRVLVHKGSGYRALGDLGGKRVCATDGSTSLRNIATAPSRPVLVSVENWSDCQVMMQQGQVEAISTDDTILAGMAQQDPTTEVVGDALSEEPYGIGIPIDHRDMVRYVNAVLEDYRSGQWQASYNRWLKPLLGAGSPPKPRYR